jgi:hypothetical protein
VKCQYGTAKPFKNLFNAKGAKAAKHAKKTINNVIPFAVIPASAGMTEYSMCSGSALPLCQHLDAGLRRHDRTSRIHATM